MAFTETSVLENQLNGKTISGIRLYNVADHYYALDTNKIAVDGAVAISFGEESLVIGWSRKQELVDCVFGKPEDVLEDIPFYEIEDVEHVFDFVGETVLSATVRWNFFEEFDDNFEIIPGKNYIIEELVLNLSNDRMLQVAAANCEIANGAINYIEFNAQGNILVVVDEKMEIASVGL